jgi:LAGLIDADG endonuclease
MAIANPITDRDAFGHWLSGFVDGEGHFCLYHLRHKKYRHGSYMTAHFDMAVRDDDSDIIGEIREFWNAGTCCFPKPRPGCKENGKIRFSVSRVSDLVNTVIPHFEKYPLRAKKRRDFLVWKQGVQILADIMARPNLGHGRNGVPKTTAQERELFKALVDTLKLQRKYETRTLLDVEQPQEPELMQRTFLPSCDR